MTLVELVIVAAATYGATRFVIVDSLLQTPRNRLIEWLYPEVFARTDTDTIRAARGRFSKLGDNVPDNAPGWRGKLAEAVACSYCAGWWIGLVMFGLYGADGWARVVVEAWTIRGFHAAFLDATR